MLTWLETTAACVWSPSRDLGVRQVAAAQSSPLTATHTLTSTFATPLFCPLSPASSYHPVLPGPLTGENKKQLGNVLYKAGQAFFLDVGVHL